MSLTQENFIQLTEHVFYIKMQTNIGVIKIPRGTHTDVYIIDSGNDDVIAQKILEILKNNIPDAKLQAIINTHSHADHCGGNPYIFQQTGCEIWTSKGEASLMEYPEIETALIWGGTAIHDIHSKFLLAKPSHATKIIEEGKDEILKIDEKNQLAIKPISLPGHYMNQIGLLIVDTDGKKSFFMGDAISGRNVIKRYWIQYLLDETKSKESLHKLAQIESDFYVPSHGDLVEDIEGLSELNIIALLETEKLILDILRTPKTTEEILKEVADRNGIKLGISQFVLIGSTLRSYLTGLYEEEKIGWSIEDNILRWHRTELK
ncbi:MBL fold metallo-hydrolase [Treponema zioleckii]|uniref:MBL fold metallo-hydrolase n=1 Tax=Treponema zioleckii TaxID=331680 RepID=UPI00168B30C5|nr:MBL fold metallo-hydrolase [Treponema zioleckii]